MSLARYFFFPLSAPGQRNTNQIGAVVLILDRGKLPSWDWGFECITLHYTHTRARPCHGTEQ
jgi:hypothetical protein